MKNKIFNIFKGLFVEQIKAFALSNFPLQHTTQVRVDVTQIIEKFELIKVKKGNIREVRLYDENHRRIHNFKIEPYSGRIIVPKY